MAVMDEQPLASAPEGQEIEQVLLGLADGSYVLSTPDGLVAECGAGVVALLATAAEHLVGLPTTDVLLSGADAEARAAFERLARSGAGDPPGPRTFRTRRADGSARVLRCVVIAVPLALGWEFTSLLGELGARDTGTWQAQALRMRHGRALEVIESVCSSGAQPDPGGRLAGILIIVRDAEAEPLTREEVGRRMAQQREAHAAAAEAARRAEAHSGQNAPAEAAAPEAISSGIGELVERTRVLAERLEDAQRDAATATTARGEALALLAEAQSQLVLEEERREAAEAQVRAARDGVSDHDRQLVDERDTARAELESTLRELESARAELDRAAEDQAELQRELGAARGQLGAVNMGLQSANERLQAMALEFDSARAELGASREEAAAMAAQLDGVRRELDAASAEAGTARGERATAHGDEAASVTSSEHPDPPRCAAGQAAALIGLDGTFKRLDSEFCRLLGCSEAELSSARWPSVIDRENLAAHEEVARALRTGELDSADVETVYMHAQGLLVPIEGRVSMLRDAAGSPSYYLFLADVSRTAGLPG